MDVGPRHLQHQRLAVDGGHPGPEHLPPHPAGSRLPERHARAQRCHPLLGHRPGHRPGRRSARLAQCGPPDRSGRPVRAGVQHLPGVRAGHHRAHRPRPALRRPAGHLERVRHRGRRRVRRPPRRAEVADHRSDRLAVLAGPRQPAGHLCRAAHPGPPLRRLHGVGGGANVAEPLRSLRPLHLRPERLRSHCHPSERRGHGEPGSQPEDRDRRPRSRRSVRPREHRPVARMGPVRPAAGRSDRPLRQHHGGQPAERPSGAILHRAQCTPARRLLQSAPGRTGVALPLSQAALREPVPVPGPGGRPGRQQRSGQLGRRLHRHRPVHALPLRAGPSAGGRRHGPLHPRRGDALPGPVGRPGRCAADQRAVAVPAARLGVDGRGARHARRVLLRQYPRSRSQTVGRQSHLRPDRQLRRRQPG